ncbi:RNA-directed DNA polymerase from mobile element jockey-like [Plakobranchus ocellatus]|uniref:RNA-directed DNA polymerase from mobile element jockey-like n=1 Tax=Plakobranchus ocellatus TaxID=259542 RepID=A0AAV4BVP1_9GAST|nr:RNA-directed DNA polymerase from mobile element jockey-like [Plakobranchus ocellatus]
MDLLCGKYFDTCLSGTFALCKLNITDDGRRKFEIPNIALRPCHLLKKLTTIKQGYCLRKDYLEGLKQAESFGQLLQAQWTDATATNAHNTPRQRKDQTIQVLPLTDDLHLM